MRENDSGQQVPATLGEYLTVTEETHSESFAVVYLKEQIEKHGAEFEVEAPDGVIQLVLAPMRDLSADSDKTVNVQVMTPVGIVDPITGERKGSDPMKLLLAALMRDGGGPEGLEAIRHKMEHEAINRGIREVLDDTLEPSTEVQREQISRLLDAWGTPALNWMQFRRPPKCGCEMKTYNLLVNLVAAKAVMEAFEEGGDAMNGLNICLEMSKEEVSDAFGGLKKTMEELGEENFSVEEHMAPYQRTIGFLFMGCDKALDTTFDDVSSVEESAAHLEEMKNEAEE